MVNVSDFRKQTPTLLFCFFTHHLNHKATKYQSVLVRIWEINVAGNATQIKKNKLWWNGQWHNGFLSCILTRLSQVNIQMCWQSWSATIKKWSSPENEACNELVTESIRKSVEMPNEAFLFSPQRLSSYQESYTWTFAVGFDGTLNECVFMPRCNLEWRLLKQADTINSLWLATGAVTSVINKKPF